MPIIHTCSSRADAEKAMTELPSTGNLRDISEGWRPTVSDYWTAERVAAWQLWAFDSHIGLCIQDRERNGYDDSDWDMLVYQPVTGTFEWYEFASTRGWTYPSYGSKPDATPEVLAKYEAYRAELAAKSQAIRETIDSMTPDIGKTVEVIKGRKVPVGLTATVFWVGAGTKYTPNWGYSKHLKVANRLGLRDASGKVYWTSADNVQVV